MSNESKESHNLTEAINLAHTLKLQGRWQDALDLLNAQHNEAANISKSLHASLWVAISQTLCDKGVFSGEENVEAREEALNEALTLAEPTQDASLIGSVYDAMGYSCHIAYINSDRSQEPENELQYFERGLQLRKEGGQRAQIAESLFHVGLVYDVIRKDYEKAIPYHKEAYALAIQEDDKVVASYAFRHLGFAHFAAKDMKATIEALDESLSLREAANFIPGIAFALVTRGHIDALEGAKEDALKRFERARQILVSLGATKRVEMVDRQIQRLEEA